jgi:DNA-binding MarR family transcriptional regulator
MQQKVDRLAAEMAAQCVGLRVSRLHRMISRRFEQALRPVGLSLPQLEVLSVLTAVDAAVAPRLLADWLAVERSTMSRNLATLERNQLVDTVERSPTGRCMSVVITELGRRTLGAAERAWRAVHDELRHALGDDVATVLDAWLAQLEQRPSEVRAARPSGFSRRAGRSG